MNHISSCFLFGVIELSVIYYAIIKVTEIKNYERLKVN
jgi:hypothetical protein